jgi:hypothetical protein
MAQPKRLRAVSANEKADRKQSVTEAAESGDHRSLLVAMRDRIARAVSNPDCPPRDLAALTRRLQDIAKELESLELREKEAGADAERHGVTDEVWNEETI